MVVRWRCSARKGESTGLVNARPNLVVTLTASLSQHPFPLCSHIPDSYLSCHPRSRFPPFYDENPIGIYQKILAGRLDIPRHVDSKAKDIIKRLLTIDRTSRLGN